MWRINVLYTLCCLPLDSAAVLALLVGATKHQSIYVTKEKGGIKELVDVD